jgi:hypothetical protein
MQSSKQSSSATQEVFRTSITDLFSRFAIVYQSKWAIEVDLIRREQIREWSKVLRDISDEVIKSTTDHWIEKNIWPPTPGEFKKFAIEVKADMKRQDEVDRARRSLPAPPTDVEVCFSKRLEAIKRIKRDNPELRWDEVGRVYEEQRRNANAEKPV